MSEKELGDALLKFDLTPAGAAAVLEVDRIIENDRRRMRWLMWLTVALWVAAAAGAVFIVVAGGFVFPAIAKALNEAGQAAQADTPFLMLAKLLAMCIVGGSLSFIVLVAAGLATVLLVFRTRRATLRQINANLLQISEQLKKAAG